MIGPHAARALIDGEDLGDEGDVEQSECGFRRALALERRQAEVDRFFVAGESDVERQVGERGEYVETAQRLQDAFETPATQGIGRRRGD